MRTSPMEHFMKRVSILSLLRNERNDSFATWLLPSGNNL